MAISLAATSCSKQDEINPEGSYEGFIFKQSDSSSVDALMKVSNVENSGLELQIDFLGQSLTLKGQSKEKTEENLSYELVEDGNVKKTHLYDEVDICYCVDCQAWNVYFVLNGDTTTFISK